MCQPMNMNVFRMERAKKARGQLSCAQISIHYVRTVVFADVHRLRYLSKFNLVVEDHLVNITIIIHNNS